MGYQVIRESGKSYVEWLPGACIANEQDALEMVAACGEFETDRLMLHAVNLTPEFFQLRTGIAGGILLKLTNYMIKAALVLKPEQVGEGKFKEWVLETNRGRDFRVFYDRARAEQWLLSD
jgi:PadR family transcriptional regulator AphA